MSDVEIDQPVPEYTENSRKKQLECYRNALKYYKSRLLALNAIRISQQQTDNIPEDMKTYSALNKNTKGLHDDIILLLSIKECTKIIQNSIVCAEVLKSSDTILKRKIFYQMENIIYITKKIMEMYREKLPELDVIKKKKEYINALANYEKHLNLIKSNYDDLNEENIQVLQKAELNVYKINLIRALKAVLIAFTSVNYPDILGKIIQFSSPSRKNLTLEDFTEGWNVGLISSTQQSRKEGEKKFQNNNGSLVKNKKQAGAQAKNNKNPETSLKNRGSAM